MICKLCPGTGNLICFQNGALEFWTCPACGGAGARDQYGPATFIRGRRIKEGK